MLTLSRVFGALLMTTSRTIPQKTFAFKVEFTIRPQQYPNCVSPAKTCQVKKKKKKVKGWGLMSFLFFPWQQRFVCQRNVPRFNYLLCAAAGKDITKHGGNFCVVKKKSKGWKLKL